MFERTNILLFQKMRLKIAFYLKEDVVEVARQLLGKYLVTNFDGQLTAGKIIETEAYRAPDDKASHAYQNRRTKRTEVMFHQGGHAYVYLCYGIHHLFNVVSAKEGIAHAVLIRALEPTDGIDKMLERRNFDKLKPNLCSGPGTVAKALGLSTIHSGHSMLDKNSSIWVEDRGLTYKDSEILASPRVGIDYAEECAAWNWRFRPKITAQK